MKIPYGKQWITEEDKEKVLEVLKSDYLTTGPTIAAFEDAFARFVGAKYAIAVANGTAALHLAAKALDVHSGTEVITTPMSFAATSNCILYNSGTPVFADITNRGLIQPSEIETKITENTAGIIPVHYMGLPAELAEISKIAKENELFVIEDACHALGAKYRGTSIGDCDYSDIAVFSFHPVKHITTGEGGIVTTNNEEIASRVRMLRSHGLTKNPSEFKYAISDPWYHEMHYLGYNYRLTDIQAALGLSQLSRIDQIVKRRREIAKVYSDFFESFPDEVELIPEHEEEKHSYHLYVIKLRDSKKRRDVFDALQNRGIYCQVHYIPIYWHPFYREAGFRDLYLPNTERFYERIISIPMYPSLTDGDIEYVLQSFREIIQ